MKKKNLFLTLLLGAVSLFSCSDDETVNLTNVPDKVQQEFMARYPNVTDVQWNVVKNYHVARFNAPTTKSTTSQYHSNAWFTNEGQFCQIAEDVTFNNLPTLVQENFTAYTTQFYPDWEIDDCEILAREGMATIFVIEIEKGEMEREISVSEYGDILKDVLDDDDEDEILPIHLSDEINAALQTIFPDTYTTLSILELEIDDDAIEIDVIENNRHKEIKLDAHYILTSVEYDVSFAEATQLIPEAILQQLIHMAQLAGLDLFDKQLQENMEIEVKETAKGYVFEVEIEWNDTELEIQIDEEGNITIDE